MGIRVYNDLISGQNGCMRKDPDMTISVSMFKKNFEGYMQYVAKGMVLALEEGRIPVILITPIDASRKPRLKIRKPTRKWSDIKLPKPLKKPVDSLKYLLEDRDSGS